MTLYYVSSSGKAITFLTSPWAMFPVSLMICKDSVWVNVEVYCIRMSLFLCSVYIGSYYFLFIAWSFTHFVVRSRRAAKRAQRVFTWGRGCVVTQGLRLRLSGGCRVRSRPLPLGGAGGNVPVVDTGHICDLLPSWWQVRVRLEWLLTPDVCWTNTSMVDQRGNWQVCHTLHTQNTL